MKIAICDDEKILRENLCALVKNQNEDCHVDLYDSGNALLDANKDYDIYFLDIQMPGIDGMKTAARIREAEKSRESVIIFITALKEYMANAFDVKAFHYLGVTLCCPYRKLRIEKGKS
jgi:DNA-binding LytR/AlgR family response regulator